MKIKKCFKCLIEKPLSEYYKHAQMGDGHLNKCKECNKKDVKDNYRINITKEGYIEKERKRGRDKAKRLYTGTNKANPKAQKNWQERYPEKKSALSFSSTLRLKGFEKHHWSYNEEHWKDVIWLTKQNHMKGHRFIVYDQERFMYRRIDTNELLDTKERHETYIKWCIDNKED